MQVAVGVLGGRHPLVHLVDRRCRPTGPSSGASSANIAQGVWPPLTAKWNWPEAATAWRARSATKAAPGAGDRRRVGQGFELVLHRWRAYCFFSAWPPNSLRMAERILSVNSPRPRDSKRS